MWFAQGCLGRSDRPIWRAVLRGSIVLALLSFSLSAHAWPISENLYLSGSTGAHVVPAELEITGDVCQEENSANNCMFHLFFKYRPLVTELTSEHTTSYSIANIPPSYTWEVQAFEPITQYPREVDTSQIIRAASAYRPSGSMAASYDLYFSWAPNIHYGILDHNDACSSCQLGGGTVSYDWQSGRLHFQDLQLASHSVNNYQHSVTARVDPLSFTYPVPEPSTAALMGLGLLGLGIRQRGVSAS